MDRGTLDNGVKHHNQPNYYLVLTNLRNKGFIDFASYGKKKLKKSEKFQSRAHTQDPQKGHPHPWGGRGAWWPKMLKFAANPPTHP